MTIQGSWQVNFPTNWNAPPQIKLNSLIPWTDSPIDGVTYFSGIATYSMDFNISENWRLSGRKIVLDLGVVKGIAEVSVNVEPVGGIL